MAGRRHGMFPQIDRVDCVTDDADIHRQHLSALSADRPLDECEFVKLRIICPDDEDLVLRVTVARTCIVVGFGRRLDHS